MKWKSSENIDKKEWHDFFAWFPVKVEGHFVWLETVQKKEVTDLWDTYIRYRFKPQRGNN